MTSGPDRWWQLRRRWRESQQAFDAQQDAFLLEAIQRAAHERGLGPDSVEEALNLHVQLVRARKRRPS